MRSAPFVFLLLGALAPVLNVGAQASKADSVGAVAAVTQFHAALGAADSVRAVSLLADDVMILESGAIQTRSDYLGHHLGADMKGSAGSKAERSVVRVSLNGSTAIVVSKSMSPPTGAEGNTGSEMAELMVLSKSASGWQIRAVHWSSRRRKA
jgi:ketosteroid isomerase-like protein